MRRLVIRPGAIGDTILAFPAMEHLRADYTEVWVRSEVAPLVTFADRVRALSTTGIYMIEIDPPAPVISALASFDEIWSWYGTGNPEFRAAVRQFPFRFLDALPGDGGEHAADFFAGQTGAPRPARPRIPIVAPEVHGAQVLHPYSGGARKNWPFECFVELARRSKFEWAHERYENLADLAEWLAGASVYVGNDSGITHLAAAVGIPVVALFGPTDPAIWAPRGDRIRVLHQQPIETIRVKSVERAIAEVLAKPAGS